MRHDGSKLQIRRSCNVGNWHFKVVYNSLSLGTIFNRNMYECKYVCLYFDLYINFGIGISKFIF